MTYNTQLENYMEKHKPYHDFGDFIGVYTNDTLPAIYNRPCCLISNYSPHTSEGSHWIAMAFPLNGRAEYFDSYGRAPDKNDYILHVKTNFGKYLKYFSYNGEYNYNNVDFQDVNSDACGQYCLYFIENGPVKVNNEITSPWKNLLDIPIVNRDNYIIKKYSKLLNS